MSAQGICRLIMAALLLFGPGLGSLFQTNYAQAEFIAPNSSLPNLFSNSQIQNSVAPAPASAPVTTCRNTYKNTGGSQFVGLAGKLSVGGNDLGQAQISLVDSNEQLLNLGPNTPNPTFSSYSGLGSPYPSPGFFTFDDGAGNFPVGNGIFNVTLKFEHTDVLTEYFLHRYNISTSVMFSITLDPATGNCLITDQNGNLLLGSTGNPADSLISLYGGGGIAGQVAVAVAPDSLYTAPPAASPLTDTSIPLAGATVEVLNYSTDSSGLITPTTPVLYQNVPVVAQSDSAGYYILGDLSPGSYVVRFKKGGYLPSTSSGGSYFRDGNLDIYPYNQAQVINYYKTVPVSVTAASTALGQFHSLIITADNSYPGVLGINGHLIAPVTITGTIMDALSVPVLGAYAELYDRTGTLKLGSSNQTGSDGVYQFNNLSPNVTYTVKAIPPAAADLVPGWHTISNTGSIGGPGDPVYSGKPTPASPSITVSNVNVTLLKGGAFAGTLTEQGTGLTLGGVQIQVYRADDPSGNPVDTSSSTISATGTYSTRAQLVPGVGYKLGFLPAGASQNYVGGFCGLITGTICSLVPNLSAAGIFTITNPADVITADAALRIGARINGNITSADGVDLGTEGLRLQINIFGAYDHALYQTLQVNASGTGVTSLPYSTASLPTNDYLVQFVPLLTGNNTGFIPAYYSGSSPTGTATIGSATPVHVESSGSFVSTDNINVALVEGGQITFRLTTRDLNNPSLLISATNILVDLYGKSTANNPGPRYTLGTTDQYGYITFKALPPGQNSFSAKVLPTGNTLAQSTITTTSNPNGLFTLVHDVPQVVDFEIKTGGTLSGRIYDPANPLYDFSGSVLTVYDLSNNKVFPTLSGSNYFYSQGGYWYYKVTLLPSSGYYLGFTPPPAPNNPYVPLFYRGALSLTDPYLSQGLQSLPVQQAVDTNGLDMVFSPRGLLQLHTVDINGNTVSGATVGIYNSNASGQTPMPNNSGPTDASGNFTSTELLAGSGPLYYAAVSLNGSPQDFYNNKTSLSTADPISITPGILNIITITLHTQVLVTGTVKLHPSSGADRPLQGVSVYAVNPSNPAVNLGGPAVTGVDGSYRLVFAANPTTPYLLKFSYTPGTGLVPQVVYFSAGAQPYGSTGAGAATTLQNSQPDENITFNRSANIYGTVNTSASGALSGATVKVLDLADQTLVYGTATSDAGGNYTISNIPPGTYIVQFSSTAPNTGTAYYLLNHSGGTTSFSQASQIGLGDRAPQQIDFTYQSNSPTGPCTINSAQVVSASTSTLTVSFNSSCNGTGQVYYSLYSGVDITTAPSVSDGGATMYHTLTLTNLQSDTNYYFKVAVTPPGGSQVVYPVELLGRTRANGSSWYFAYGDTRNNASLSNAEMLHILNYGSSLTANVTISYYTGSGVFTRGPFAVSPSSRIDIDVASQTDPYGLNSINTALASGTLHATIVSSDNPILVERSIYSSNSAMTNGNYTSGGTEMPGSTALGTDWSFPEATLDANHDNYFSLFNPSSTQTCLLPVFFKQYPYNQADPSPGFFAGSVITVPARISLSVNLRTALASSSAPAGLAGVATRFIGQNCATGETPRPIVAEQHILYNNNSPSSDQYRKGETYILGAIGNGLQWYFLENGTDKVTSRNYMILNDGIASNGLTATVTFTIQLDNPPAGSPNPVIIKYTVAPYTLANIPLSNLNVPQIGRNFGFSVMVNSDQPVVVQRSIGFVWQQRPVKDGIFSQLGTTHLGPTWLFAAGSTSNDQNAKKLNDLAINVYNPNSLAVRLRFTYYYKNNPGDPTQTAVFSNVYLNAKARTTIQPGARSASNYPSLDAAYKVVAVKVEAIDSSGNVNSSLPIFAERMVYWTWGSLINGGNAVYGYNPPGS